MGAWDKLQNGISNIGDGLGGFALDTLKIGREFGQFDFSDGLGILVDTVQEDLIGKALTGLIGPEGIGGAAFGALPEPVRNPIGSVGSTLINTAGWAINELVDRPLGTFFTVLNLHDTFESLTNPSNVGKMFDLGTWSRAWEINDKRTFGQSFIASAYLIDPFDEDEYNSVKDDPVFNFLSGTADLFQEFLDPTALFGGVGLKAARGSLVATTGTGKVIGRTYRSTGMNGRIGRYAMPRTGELRPSRVIGAGTGLRPGTIAGRESVTIGGRELGFLTKTDEQRKVIKEIQANVTAQRVRNVADSAYINEVFGRSIDAAENIKGVALDANERFSVIKTALGPIGKKMDPEAMRMIANGETFAKRKNTFRLLSGDFQVLDEAAEGARLVVDELGALKPELFDEPGFTMGNRVFSPEAQDAIDSYDFAMFNAFEQNLVLSQRKGTVLNDEGYYTVNPAAYDTIAEVPARTALAGLEQMLGSVDSTLANYNVAKLADRPDAATNLLRQGAFGGRIKDLPFGSRVQELARMHRQNVMNKGSSYAEYINPSLNYSKLAGWSTSLIRWSAERLPHTHIFFTEANSIEQFDRVLKQAERIDNGSVIQKAGVDRNQILGEFTALKLDGRYRAMEDLYNNTITKINKQMDSHFKNPEYGSLAGVDPSHRTVSDMWKTADDAWKIEREEIFSITNPKGEVPTATQPGKVESNVTYNRNAYPLEEEQISLRLVRDENANVIVQQFGISPSQAQQSAVLPRYDIIDKQIRLWNEAKDSRRVRLATKIAETKNKRAQLKGKPVDPDYAQEALERAVVPIRERILGPVRNPANDAYSYWRKGVLATPKWPMRVQLDEQLRIAANLGALSTIANFAGGFERMRQAQAVHKLEGWDEFKKVQVLQEEMVKYANANRETIIKTLEETVDSYTLAAVGAEFNKYSLTDLYRVVGREGFEVAVNNVTKQIVKQASNRAKIRRNYLLKGAAFMTFMGNPVMGASYGLFARHSRLRRINEAGQQTAALHYAGALKAEGRRLLNEAVDSADVQAAKELMSDADYIAGLAKKGGSGVRVSNAFEAAEELLEQAGFSGISVGNSIFRGAFGDDTRFIEQIEASNSANEALSSIYRSAHDIAVRELNEQRPDYAVVDFLDRPSGEKWDEAFGRQMNRMTSGTSNTNFYRIVWDSNLDLNQRVDALVDLFEQNPALFTDLVQNSLDLISNDWLGVEDLRIVAREMAQEYDQVIPQAYFPNVRARAAAGETRWDLIEKEFPQIVMATGKYTKEQLLERFDTKQELDRFFETEAINIIREDYPGFAKSFAPKTIADGTGAKRLKSWVDDKFENIFSVLAEIPSDQLSRHPYFKTVYEKEIRRITQDLVDSDGMLALSQNKMNEIESFAREQALTDTRELLYDLRENTRAAEVLANISPFFNAWQEVIGRWAGIAVDNPTFVAQVGRLYSKPWEAEALGLVEIEDENGNKYVTFRMTGGAYDDEGNSTTIFDAMPESVKNRFIPAPLRSTTDTVRISKDSLNTLLEGTPGVGPFVTVPLREAIVAQPQLEETFAFMFPFGHPQGGMLERIIKANLPSWSKSVYDMLRQGHRYEAVQTRMFRDLVTQAEASGEYIDYSDEAVWTAFQEESESRANHWFLFKVGAALLSPASTTLVSPYDPLVQEFRVMRQEHGYLIAEDMFLTKYGEDFHALTSSLSRSNDGLPAAVETENLRTKYESLINDLGDSGVAAYVVRAVGSDLEQLRYNQTIYNQQFLQPVAPGSKTRRRELYTGRELIENSQTRLGWKAYSEVADWVRSKQDEADAAGLSTSLNAGHLRVVSAVKQLMIQKIGEDNPAWLKEFNDTQSSDNKRNDINAAFMKVLSDPDIRQRDSALQIAEYYRVRYWVQTQLEARKAAGGSNQLERTQSNEDLFQLWETIRTEMSLRPHFSAVFDRYFTRDMISSETFIDPKDFPEGFLISG